MSQNNQPFENDQSIIAQTAKKHLLLVSHVRSSVVDIQILFENIDLPIIKKAFNSAFKELNPSFSTAIHSTDEEGNHHYLSTNSQPSKFNDVPHSNEDNQRQGPAKQQLVSSPQKVFSVVGISLSQNKDVDIDKVLKKGADKFTNKLIDSLIPASEIEMLNVDGNIKLPKLGHQQG